MNVAQKFYDDIHKGDQVPPKVRLALLITESEALTWLTGSACFECSGILLQLSTCPLTALTDGRSQRALHVQCDDSVIGIQKSTCVLYDM
jgi:hypothetical protein